MDENKKEKEEIINLFKEGLGEKGEEMGEHYANLNADDRLAGLFLMGVKFHLNPKNKADLFILSYLVKKIQRLAKEEANTFLYLMCKIFSEVK